MLFSVITITRNNAKGLEATYASLAAQGFTDYEWIVIDGDSEDSTLDFLKDKPAFVVSEPDRGIYDAMNKGIDRAGGAYLIFMNAGDRFAGPDVLQALAEIVKAKPAFVYGDSYEGGFYKKARHHHKRFQGMFTHHQAMVYAKDALGDLRYDLRYKIAADYDLTLRFLNKAGAFVYWPQPICVFEAGGISQQNAGLGRLEQFLIRKGLGVSPLINGTIFALQYANYTLRKLCPPLYQFLKRGSCGNTASGIGPE